MAVMSSFPSLTETPKNRRPFERPSESSSWGDAPSFSFDFYDHNPHRKTGTLSVQDVTPCKEFNDIKPRTVDRPRRIVFQDEVQHLEDKKGKVTNTIRFSEKGSDSGALNRSIPTGLRTKPHMVPDYALKYPEIRSAEERENYKAVFNDQYAEYKELYSEVKASLLKFKELDSMMEKLTCGPQSKKAPERIKVIAEKIEKKKKDPAFVEKQERCTYLKEKLSHIKKQIQVYDQRDSSVYF